jgi:hypothetical protein
LRGIVGEMIVSQAPSRRRKDPSTVPLDQPRKCRFVAVTLVGTQ